MIDSMNNLEPKYNVQMFSFGFLISFFLFVVIWYPLYTLTMGKKFTSTGLFISIIASFVIGIVMGAVLMFGSRRKAIKKAFTDKKQFLDKINVSLYQLRYIKDLDTENFVSYKPSIGLKTLAVNTNIAFDKDIATISGPIGIINKLEKNI